METIANHELDGFSKDLYDKTSELEIAEPMEQLAENPTKAENMSKEEKEKEKRSMITSIAILCVLISLTASALNAMYNAQTSLLPTDGMGNTIATIGSASTVVSAALLNSYLLSIAGIKKTMTISMSFIVLYMAAFFYPKWELVIPAAIMGGITVNLMMSSWFAYANSVAYWHNKLFGGDLSLTITLVIGITNMSASGGFLWGNLVMYFILDENEQDNNANATTERNVSGICGINYCNEDLYSSTNAQPPSENRYLMLIGAFTFMAVLGTVGTFFLADIPLKLQSDQNKKNKKFRDFLEVLRESWNVIIQPKGFLPVFLIVFVGLEGVFTASVFTQAFISCNVGVSKVGFFMFAFGISEIIVSGLQWALIRTLGRPLLIILVYATFMGCYIYLLLSPEFNTLVYFVIVVLFGLGDATLISTIFSLYGYLFPDSIEGAFSLVNFWWGFAIFIPFLLNQYLCVRTKIYILMGMGTIGFGIYLALEMILKMKSSKTYPLHSKHNIKIAESNT